MSKTKETRNPFYPFHGELYFAEVFDIIEEKIDSCLEVMELTIMDEDSLTCFRNFTGALMAFHSFMASEHWKGDYSRSISFGWDYTAQME